MEWCQDRKKYVYQHRLVMEKHLGRRLSRQEIVHHKDNNKINNKIENLQLYASISEHMKMHSLNGDIGFIKGEKRPWQELKKVDCIVCGKKMKPYLRRGKRSDKCSIACSNKARARSFSGGR